MLNHEWWLRGRKFQVLFPEPGIDKSSDFHCDCKKHKGFKDRQKDIKDIKKQGSNKMEKFKKEGISLREAATLTEKKKVDRPRIS